MLAQVWLVYEFSRLLEDPLRGHWARGLLSQLPLEPVLLDVYHLITKVLIRWPLNLLMHDRVAHGHWLKRFLHVVLASQNLVIAFP